MNPLVMWIAIGVVCVIWQAIDDALHRKRIRALLNATDRQWIEIINKHQKEIAEAYWNGKPFVPTVDRRD
jgi:hypothetical protein